MSDPLDNLPSTPGGDPVTAELTKDTVKATISGKLFDELTNGDDIMAERAIEAATVRAEGLFGVLKKTLSLDVPLHREIVRNLAVYELFSLNGDTKGGKMFLQAATDLITINFGDAQSAATTRIPSGAMAKPKRRPL